MLKNWICWLAVAFLPVVIQAQVVVSVGEVTTDGSQIVGLDVSGKIEQSAAGSLSLEFSYNAQVFEVLGVRRADGDLFACDPIGFDQRLDGLDPTIGLLTIECSNASAGEGRFCTLEIRSVRSAELVGEITLDAARRQDEPLLILDSTPGKVIVTSTPVVFEDAESLGGNFPNPFFTDTEFQYTLAADNVEVRFTVFTFGGINVFAETVIGSRGQNLWKFDPAKTELYLAQGMYLLLMETPNGVYTLPFQHLR